MVGLYTPLNLEDYPSCQLLTLSHRPGLPEHPWLVPVGCGCGGNTPRRIVWRGNLEDKEKVLEFREGKAIAEGTYHHMITWFCDKQLE